MVCKKCGAEIVDGEMFCVQCGAELYTGENLADNENESAPETNEKPKKEKKIKPKKEKKRFDGLKPAQKKKDPNAPHNVEKGLKISAIIVAIILIGILIVVIINNINQNKATKIAEKVPLGRTIEYCEKETEIQFSKTTKNNSLRLIHEFDYVATDENETSINGTKMPNWAILVTTDDEENISEVYCYNFSMLKTGWQGVHSDIRLTQESISYGMNKKDVNNELGMKPYCIKRKADNTSTYVYRYYFVDNDTGNERVFNYFVQFNDLNDTVITVAESEINYIGYIMGITTE